MVCVYATLPNVLNSLSAASQGYCPPCWNPRRQRLARHLGADKNRKLFNSRAPLLVHTSHRAQLPEESCTHISAMADLSARDVERANFAFSIYDFDGSGTVDAIHLGNILRALNLNPTQATVEKLGGTKKKNEKKLKVDEFLPIFSQVKKEKDVGCYEDFLECLKLYDKAEDGKMLAAELSHTLLSLGERLVDNEVDEILKDCLDPEDEDGFVPYAPFLKNLMS